MNLSYYEAKGIYLKKNTKLGLWFWSSHIYGIHILYIFITLLIE